jgi:hypothetical protein
MGFFFFFFLGMHKWKEFIMKKNTTKQTPKEEGVPPHAYGFHHPRKA